MPDLRRTPPEESQECAGARGRAKEVGQPMGSLGELDCLDPWLVEQDRSFEDIHRRGIEPGAQIHIAPAVLTFAFDHRGSGFTREPGGVQQIIILEDPDRASPLQRRQGGFHRAAEGIVEGDQAGSFTGAEQKV